LGRDNLIFDEATGRSHISVDDYAVAMIDELENPGIRASASRSGRELDIAPRGLLILRLRNCSGTRVRF